VSRQNENTGFLCLHCGLNVLALSNGSYRNHCPSCLYSRHVDVMPGDRASLCRSLMQPVGLTYKAKKGWQIMHQCITCRTMSVNKVAVDTVQPDDYQAVAGLGSSVLRSGSGLPPNFTLAPARGRG
jgi:hypothetical protein